MTISVTDTALDIEKKAIERCSRRNPFRSWMAWIFCSIFLASFTGFYVFWCTNTYRDYVLSQMELRNGTRNFDWWQRPPIKLLYKIHVFNYTNVDEFEAGEANKLRVQELGPYIYRETMNRVNVAINENGTVTYQEKRSYQWVDGKPDNDTVVIPNIPLMFATAFVRDRSLATQYTTSMVLFTLGERPFITESAGGFIWGYDTKLFEMSKPLIMLQRGDIPFDKFGMLAMKNGVNQDRITMHTGLQGLDKLGMIDRVNGVDNRNVWGDKRCDKIMGTNGILFPPDWIENTNIPLYIYSKELCRKLPFHFTEETTVYGIPALRYKLIPDAFNSSDTQNACYCPKMKDNTRICPPAGLFNMSACNYNSPMLMSFPHFYGGDKSLLEQVDGLNPRQEDHESYVDIHPRLGISFAGRTRMQLNLEVRTARHVPYLGNLKDGTILPLIWFEIGVDELPESILEMLRAGYFTVIIVEIVLQWCILIAMILSLGALVASLWQCRTKQDAAFRRNSSGDNNIFESP